jgi:PST family polysaccharide transporter
LAFLFRGLSVVAEFLLRRELQFRRIAFVAALSYAFAYGGVGIGLALYGFGVWALVMAQICQAALSSVIFFLHCPHSIRPLIDVQALKVLLRYGIGESLGTVVGYIAGYFDKIIVGRWLGAEALGIYERSYQLLTNSSRLLGSSLQAVLFPVMAQLQSEPKRLGQVYVRATAASALIILPFSCIAVVLAPELIWILLGPQWSAAVLPFQVLAMALLFHTSTRIGGALAAAMGAVYKKLVRQVVLGLLVLCGAGIAWRWGISGVAMAVLLARFVDYFTMGALCLRLTGQRWSAFLRAHIPAAWASIAVTISVYSWATLLRTFDNHALVTLFGSATATILLMLVLIRLAPNLFLGDSGKWAASLLNGYIKQKRAKRRSPITVTT